MQPVTCPPGQIFAADGVTCIPGCNPGYVFGSDGATCVPAPTSSGGGSADDGSGGGPAAPPAPTDQTMVNAPSGNSGATSAGTAAPLFTPKNLLIGGGLGLAAYFLFLA